MPDRKRKSRQDATEDTRVLESSVEEVEDVEEGEIPPLVEIFFNTRKPKETRSVSRDEESKRVSGEESIRAVPAGTVDKRFEQFLKVLNLPAGTFEDPFFTNTHYCVLNVATEIVDVTTVNDDTSFKTYDFTPTLAQLGWFESEFS